MITKYLLYKCKSWNGRKSPGLDILGLLFRYLLLYGLIESVLPFLVFQIACCVPLVFMLFFYSIFTSNNIFTFLFLFSIIIIILLYKAQMCVCPEIVSARKSGNQGRAPIQI